MTAFVLDASAATVWLLRKSQIPANRRNFLEENEAIVPNLWHPEVRNAILVSMRHEKRTIGWSIERFNIVKDWPTRTDEHPDWKTALRLADKHGLSFYDALYLELAKRHKVPIATFDKELVKGAVAEGISLVF